MTKLGGVYAAVVTPFDDNGLPSREQFVTCLCHLEKRGCHGVLVSGTTGEGQSLSVEERTRLFEWAAKADTTLHLIAGTGAASLTDTVTLTRAAYDAEMDAAAIIPPFFYKGADDEGLLAFYGEVLRQAVPADGQVVLYHNPVTTAVGLSLDLIRRLRESFPTQMVGIKDSSQDWERAKTLIESLPGFSVLLGDDRLLSKTLAAGGSGSITLVANAFADLDRAVFDANQAGRDTGDAQTRLTNAHRQFDGLPRIPAIKMILKAGGIIENDHVRPPLRQLTAEETMTLKERFMLDMEIPGTLKLSDLYDVLGR